MPHDSLPYVIEREAGIDYDRLKAWFDGQPQLGCKVTLKPQSPRSLGRNMKLPRTLMRIEGSAEAVQDLYRRFELQFMSAGG